jgi:hypothetical protein
MHSIKKEINIKKKLWLSIENIKGTKNHFVVFYLFTIILIADIPGCLCIWG